MRRLSLEVIQPGMIIAKSLLGSSGQILLKAGTELKSQYLLYLKKLGVNHLYIQDERISDIVVEDVVSDETRHTARVLVKELIKKYHLPAQVSRETKLDQQVEKMVSQIIDELLSTDNAIMQLSDIRAVSDYLFAHSVNCCIMTSLVAAKMNYNKKTVRHIALGALLHDIGMAAVPEKIINKPGTLTGDEQATVKNHPIYGYEMFKKSPLFHGLSGAVILQHHERNNGKGYPENLSGDEINKASQIMGVVDTYDALTSERPYRQAFYPHEAIEMLMSQQEAIFNPEVLAKFLSVIAAYPVGSHVLLSNGESGLVIGTNPGFTLRPNVRVLYTGQDQAPHPAPYDLDLSEHLDIVITKVIE